MSKEKQHYSLTNMKIGILSFKPGNSKGCITQSKWGKYYCVTTNINNYLKVRHIHRHSTKDTVPDVVVHSCNLIVKEYRGRRIMNSSKTLPGKKNN